MRRRKSSTQPQQQPLVRKRSVEVLPRRPMSARPFAETNFNAEEQMIIRQDREELRLNLRDFAEQIKAVEKERKGGLCEYFQYLNHILSYKKTFISSHV